MESVETCFYCNQPIEEEEMCCAWAKYYQFTGCEDFCNNELFKLPSKPKKATKKTCKESIEYDLDAFDDFLLIGGIRLK